MNWKPAWPLPLQWFLQRSQSLLSHRSHRWHGLFLFYKAQLSPPPTAEHKARKPCAERLGVLTLTKPFKLLGKKTHTFFSLLWNSPRKTARRTRRSAPCATRACRALREPWVADMCSATTVWSRRWSASTATASSGIRSSAPSVGTWPSSRSRRKHCSRISARVTRRPWRCLFQSPR